MAGTVSDTIYLLLYKKLSYEPTPWNSDGYQTASATEGASFDDEEAMLLAKTMALSAGNVIQHRCQIKGRVHIQRSIMFERRKCSSWCIF